MDVASSGTVQVEAHDSGASQQPPPPLPTSGLKTLQAQTDSTQDAAEDPFDMRGVHHELEKEFDASANKMKGDTVEGILMRRVMEAKLTLIHEEMRLRHSENVGDYQIPLRSAAINTGIERLCESRSSAAAAAAFTVANGEESSVKVETNLAFLQPEYYIVGRRTRGSRRKLATHWRWMKKTLVRMLPDLSLLLNTSKPARRVETLLATLSSR